MKLLIKYKERSIEIFLDQNQPVKMIRKLLENQTKVPAIQQQLSYKSGQKKIILSDDQLPLRLAKLPQNTQLQMKNLGKQIRWDYVFYIQYFGPIFIFPILYLIGKKQNYTEIQCWALVMALLHYIKRQYETAFVHVFSRYTMPFKRVFINCIHYWVLFALLNSIQLYIFPSGHSYQNWVIYTLFGAWAIFQFCNYKCHMILASFRKIKQKNDNQYQNASKKRGIPYGWGFNMVSCANYFWQALGWITFSILTRSWTSYIFTILSIYQMTQWAIKKHQGYKKEFGDKYPKGRKAIFPFII